VRAIQLGAVLLSFILVWVNAGQAAPPQPGNSIAQAPTQAPNPKPPRPAQPPSAKQPPSAPATEQQASQTVNLAPGAGWVSRCVSASRQSPVECSMEQTAALTNTGQVLAAVTVRVPADTRQPVMMVQLPVGLYLPAGLVLQVDESKPQTIPLQTCDVKGCYAGMQVNPELLSALKGGKRLTMTFEDLAKHNIAVPFALDNFAETLLKIE
jgi:invasion protein IalB